MARGGFVVGSVAAGMMIKLKRNDLTQLSCQHMDVM